MDEERVPKKSTVKVLKKRRNDWDVKGKLWMEASGCCVDPKVPLGCQEGFFSFSGKDNLHLLFGSAGTQCED